MTWGGSHDLIVALEADGSLSPELWSLVELFDADKWAKFVETPRHLELIGESAFEQWLAPRAQSFAEHNGVDIGEARGFLQESAMNSPFSGLQLSEALVSDIRRRTGVATRFDAAAPVIGYFADQAPKGAVVDVLNLRPLPRRVRIPVVDHLSVEIQLIAAMRWGALSPSALGILDEAGCQTLRRVVDVTDVDRLLTAAWFGNVRWWPTSEPGIADDPYLARFNDDLFFTETPFALSSIGCAQLSRPDYNFEHHQTIVVGSKAQDFCYALALSRAGVPTLWLPDGLLDDTEYGPPALRALVRGLAASAVNQDISDQRILVRSMSLQRSDLDATAKRVSDELRLSDARTVEVMDDVALPAHGGLILGDAQHYDERLEEPFDGDTMARRLSPLLPSRVGSADPWKLQWWVDVEQPDTPLPARSRLNQMVVVSDGAFGPFARCGRGQVSYPSHSMGLVLGGSSLVQMAARPRLRFPDASSVFHELFKAAGFECSESSAGRFRRLATELWGGLVAFSTDLAAVDRFDILRTWLKQDDKKASVPRPPGIQLRARRYLSLEEIQSVGKHDNIDETRELIDTYLVKGIVRRGLVLKCRSCLHTDWYPLDDVGHDFKCGRCRTQSLIVRNSWVTPTHEPTPYYDLAEVVFQALKLNCHVPIGALAMLKKTSRAFAEAPELEVRIDPNTKVELDLLVISDGKIGLGEAKKSNKLDGTARDAKRWLHNLKLLCHAVHADFVVFATACDDWAPATRDHITSVFAPGGTTEVLYLPKCVQP